MKFFTFETKKEASKEAYNTLKQLINPNSTLGLATGSTPTDLYAEMIEDYKEGNFSYKDIHTFNLDEYVGLDYSHPESYHSFMDTNLFNHIDINKNNVNLPDPNSENSVQLYQALLNDSQIDVQILGVGANGHIGFNEPGTPFNAGVHIVDLKEETIKANSRFFDNDINLVPKQAITMGIDDIMKAKHIILLAFGKEKKEAIKQLTSGDLIDESIPCTILKKHPSVFVFIDKEADYR